MVGGIGGARRLLQQAAVVDFLSTIEIALVAIERFFGNDFIFVDKHHRGGRAQRDQVVAVTIGLAEAFEEFSAGQLVFDARHLFAEDQPVVFCDDHAVQLLHAFALGFLEVAPAEAHDRAGVLELEFELRLGRRQHDLSLRGQAADDDVHEILADRVCGNGGRFGRFLFRFDSRSAGRLGRPYKGGSGDQKRGE